ncbi:hypothetical protein ACIRP3_23785 [Streptomyces sp. NPDC101209]|uniref:hypothetical protein n=1 Tax=Streptomyces sp. NPDC101209 TaxID=3366129 RepID=UPI0038052017
MSVNGNGPQAARRAPGAVTCPLPALRPADDGEDDPWSPDERQVKRTDSKERAALMEAFANANSGLAQAHSELGERAAEVLRSAEGARGAIEAVQRFDLTRAPARARQRIEDLDAAHAEDGPEDLRRSSRLWRWVLLPLVVLAGMAFDTSFIGKILQYLMQAGPDQPAYYLAYLPGLAVPICLLAAGTLLAESVFRHRIRTVRTTQRERRRPALEGRRPRIRRTTETREGNGLPWPGIRWPLLFTTAILAMSGFWAYTRTVQIASRRTEFLAAYRPAVVVLLIMLGVATVMAKIIAHNPYADRSTQARKLAKESEETAEALLAAARDRLALHVTSWSRLRSATLAAEDRAHRAVEDVCIRLVQDRARSGVAGEFAFPLRVLAWPWPSEETSDVPGGGPEPPPRVRLELLDEIHAMLKRFTPDLLHQELDAVARRVNGQWEVGGQPGTEQSGTAETGT